jgi:hypothetical protein
MGEESSEVKRHIDEQRQELGANIHVLQRRVKDKFDWRLQFEQRPMTIVGVAFGVGLLLSGAVPSIARGSRHKEDDFVNGNEDELDGRSTAPQSHENAPSRSRGRISQALDSIQGALIGVAASKMQEYVDRFIPGFSEHYDRAQRQTRTPAEF